MSTDPASQGATTLPPIVEDLFLTESFLIKGRIAHKYQRLTKMLEDAERTFIQIDDAVMVSLRGNEMISTPSVLVNRQEIIFAHELVDIAGDGGMRQLATKDKPVKIRAFYSGAIQLELSGQIAAGAYEPSHNAGRWYFIIEQPLIRGLDMDGNQQLGLLKSLPYAIVRKDKLAYIYDFG